MKLTSFFRRNLLTFGLVSVAVFATRASTQAALITWGAPTGISGDSDVSTAGTLVGAFNMGLPGVVSTTVNGVTFTGLGFSGTVVSSGNFSFSNPSGLVAANGLGTPLAPFSLLSVPYQALLSSAAGGVNTPVTLTISGLTIGAAYEFQWWTNHSTFPNVTATSLSGGSVTLNSNTGTNPGGLGQFALGTFTADALTQVIVFSSTTGGPIVNGVQLRQLAQAPPVPEPGTALAGVALLGLCGMRRRR